MNGYHTLYELVAIHPKHGTILIAYCKNKSRSSIWRAILNRADAFQARIGDHIDWGKRAADGGTCGEWTIR